MSFFDRFSEVAGVVAEKVDDNKYLATIKDTFTFLMPIVIIGSFATLANVILTNEQTGLARFGPFQFLSSWAPAFSAINFATLSIMTLAVIVVLSINLAKRIGANELFSALVSLSVYVSVVPQGITSIVDGAEQLSSGLPANTIDAGGLFVGMILTIITVEAFNYLSTIEQLKIKMPPSVPGAITKSFSTMIPIAIILFTTSLAGRFFYMGTGLYINEFVYSILQAPVELFFQTTIGIVFVTILMQLFWLVGIHGGLVTSPVRNPILIAGLAANIAAYNAGQIPTSAVTFSSWFVFFVPGGAGLTLSLIIAIFIASKREDHRAIAKIGFLPGIFGISEPIVFGLPLVLNPLFAIPFVLGSGIATAIYMLAVNIGFVIPAIVDVPFGVPIILSAFIGFGLNGVILQIIILTVGVLLYLPFVLLANRHEDKI